MSHTVDPSGPIWSVTDESQFSRVSDGSFPVLMRNSNDWTRNLLHTKLLTLIHVTRNRLKHALSFFCTPVPGMKSEQPHDLYLSHRILNMEKEMSMCAEPKLGSILGQTLFDCQMYNPDQLDKQNLTHTWAVGSKDWWLWQREGGRANEARRKVWNLCLKSTNPQKVRNNKKSNHVHL